ncbi:MULTISPECIES: 3',5'-cyclic-nucleotide phosphodiesterase [Cetobacterium]|uniref:3',5'-cyclic-nucleotide phosphodiesterase n=1 Tax=Candidatus Cetobacterium colombiensis TaxID=3073100 RepID=A0ABU4W635_9FUSO|nr:3',5'-cyclic-nucleotide phosphodiesterase [Candidatus Cetobacterium colombiensis]MDX8334996.1 3',5'-cyclic-nucleotide phosphodiesterase [Candidatus Cetobacterium colombiensis]
MKKLLSTIFLVSSLVSYAQEFQIITLGSNGGVIDGDISGYLVRNKNEENFIALDAGTILPGIKAGLEKNNFKGITIPKDTEWSDTGYIFREKIKGYLISHGHLDHISGLVISSTEDTKKDIYGLKSTIETLKNNVFNWKLWPNFTNEGEGFKLNQYTYQELNPSESKNINNTTLKVSAFPLSHSNYESTMFLIENNGEYLAYYGDVGPDIIENSNGLEESFKIIGPLIKEKKIKAIMIESSFDNSKEDKGLFGHLSPKWINKEFEVLEKYSGKGSLKNLNVVITHIKPSLKKNDNMREKIKKELLEDNKYGVKYYFPVQGESLEF